jgi:hypothetical protein
MPSVLGSAAAAGVVDPNEKPGVPGANNVMVQTTQNKV